MLPPRSSEAPPGEIVLPPGYRSLWFDEIDSTSEEARRQAQTGAGGGLWILAGCQTAGRGRRGRQWVSPRGNFLGTLLLRPSAPLARLGELSFVAAVAVAQTLETLSEAQIAVKWPNDVLIAGAKAAGILLESSADSSGAADWIAIGIGINLAHHPDDTPYAATSVRAHAPGPATHPLRVLAILGEAWHRGYEGWMREGFAPTRTAWLSRAAHLGAAITARLGSEEITGRFRDVNEEGALVMETSGGVRQIRAGEVFFSPSNR